ncbi:MAG: carboxypeptidase-like regulatory domain-containing protein [Actinomycetota bacterium]|nr:carboxypeptidase-like regulatory domain-containing protein [Actinomycetota bacterium]
MSSRHLIPGAVAGALVLALATPPGSAAASTGRIEGRVVNETTGRPQEGVRVTLTTALEDGSLGRRLSTVSDAAGRYEFTGLAADDDRFYAVDARYERGLFAGGVVRIPEGTARPPVIETKLRVWETTTDPRAIVVERDSIFVAPSEDGIGIIEAVQVTNTTDEAYVGRGRALGAERDGSVPTLGFALPPGAELPPAPIVDADIDIPEIVETTFGFAATVAIPPGSRRVAYSYELRGEGGTYDLSRPALYPVLEVGVYAAEPLTIDGNRVAPDGTEEVEGRTYDRYSTSEPLEPGDRLQMVAVAEAAPGRLLAIGGGAVALGVLAVAAVLLVRRRRPPAPLGAERPSRERLVEAIARLDVSRDRGLVSEDEWATRRADLKARLERESSPG